jgi:hypothetical protein
MGLLSDTLRHLLARDPAERRAGLAGLLGRHFGVAPIRLAQPTAVGDPSDDSAPVPPCHVFHFPKSGGGVRPRSFAVTLTLGLAEAQGRELVAVTLADARDPSRDRFAAMLSAIAEVAPSRGQVVALPAGCLGRSSHVAVVVTEPWPLAGALPDYERAIGARLDLCVPVTQREADWIAARSADPFLAAMRDQGVAPLADRPPGETRLPV